MWTGSVFTYKFFILRLILILDRQVCRNCRCVIKRLGFMVSPVSFKNFIFVEAKFQYFGFPAEEFCE